MYVTGSVSSGGVVSEEFSARTDESGRMCALDIKTVDQSHLGKFFSEAFLENILSARPLFRNAVEEL